MASSGSRVRSGVTLTNSIKTAGFDLFQEQYVNLIKHNWLKPIIKNKMYIKQTVKI